MAGFRYSFPRITLLRGFAFFLIFISLFGEGGPAHAEKLQGTVSMDVISPQNRVVLIAVPGDHQPIVQAEDMAVTVTREERMDVLSVTGAPQRLVDYTLFY